MFCDIWKCFRSVQVFCHPCKCFRSVKVFCDMWKGFRSVQVFFDPSKCFVICGSVLSLWATVVIRWIDAEYVNIVKYEPLKGSSYIELPAFLKNFSKGLINLKNKDDKCFMWCHIRHLNPQAKDPQRVKIVDKKICFEFRLHGYWISSNFRTVQQNWKNKTVST